MARFELRRVGDVTGDFEFASVVRGAHAPRSFE
jgi:hypothetical protein